MKLLNLIMVLTLFSASLWANAEHDAESSFAKGDFEKAVEQYTTAVNENPKNLNLQYNLGTAQYKLGKLEESVKTLRQVAIMADSNLAAKSWYNAGNSQYRMAMSQAEPPKKISLLKESIAFYKEGLKQKTTEKELKVKMVKNLEFAQVKLKEALDQQKENEQKDQENKQDQPKPSENAKRILAKALDLVAKGMYKDARALLSDLIDSDETAANYKSHLQRIEDLVDISEGKRPERSFDHSNHENDLEVI